MKKAVLLSVMVIIAGCQTIDIETVPLDERFHQVVVQTYRDKSSAYKLANIWFIDSFRSAEAVIQYQDKEEGVIAGKAKEEFFIENRYRAVVLYTLIVEIKEGCACITFQNMRIIPDAPTSLSSVLFPNPGNYYTPDVHRVFIRLSDRFVADFEEYLQTPEKEW